MKIELFDVSSVSIIIASRFDPVDADIPSNDSDLPSCKNVEHYKIQEQSQ
jgi:hypothetical protein